MYSIHQRKKKLKQTTRKKTTNGVVITNIENFVGTRKTQKYTRKETYLLLNLIAFHYRPLQ